MKATRMKKPRFISRRHILNGKVVRLTWDTVKLPNGEIVEMEVAWHPGAAAVVPMKDNGNVVLVRQYRYAAGGYIYEVPAGKLSKGENPASCARRELEEEVGLRAGRIKKLGAILMTPGFCDEKIHLFLATSLTPCPQALEYDEVLSAVEMPYKKALDMIRSGEITDAKTITALLLCST